MKLRPELSVLPGTYSICRLPAGSALPGWMGEPSSFYSVTRTAGELSFVCSKDVVPVRESELPPGFKEEPGWRIFKIEGPLDFNLTGILSELLGPLADAGISIFALSTYDTDYIMVKEESYREARRVLEKEYTFTKEDIL